MRLTTVALGLLALLSSAAAAPAVAQIDRASVTLATEARDNIVAALRIEAEAVGLTFVRANKYLVLFTKDVGSMPVRGRMTPVTLEVTFFLDREKPGTRVQPTEELVARLKGGFEERRKPNPRERAELYQGVLDRMKERLEGPVTEPADTTPAGP
jgi:hypothetical protein